MPTASNDIGEQIYEITMRFASVTEFGVSLDAVLAGETAPPPEGARFDVALEGASTGPHMRGNFSGVDYMRVRADGKLELHIHAKIETDDDERISLFADGVIVRHDGSPIAELRESVTLTTASSAYAWVNQLQVWAQGTVDLDKQEACVKGYASRGCIK